MRAVVVLLLACGCRQLLGFESAAATDGDPGRDVAIDMPSCATGCSSDLPFCLDGTCVQCIDSTGCTDPAQAVCTSDHVCRACATHDDCTSAACLPDGSCAVETDVAYVDPSGTAGECTKAAPCATLAQGAAKLRPTIKISGTVTDTITTNLNQAVVIVSAPGAVLTRTGTGDLLQVSNNAAVEIYDLTITGQVNSGNTAVDVQNGVVTLERVRVISNAGVGVNSRNGSTVTMRRCIVALNLEGGADLENSVIHLSNSLVVKNGTTSSTVGGLRLKANAGSTLELVTIADNASGASNETGVRCDQAIDAHSSIVHRNTVDASCGFHHTLFEANAPNGVGNINGDPKFKSTDNPASPDFYRIQATSDAIDKASSTLAIDIDGQPRPAGAVDMGADEFVP